MRSTRWARTVRPTQPTAPVRGAARRNSCHWTPACDWIRCLCAPGAQKHDVRKRSVDSVMREVTGSDPDGDRFIGRIFLGPNNILTADNDTQTGMMLGRGAPDRPVRRGPDRVLALAARSWFRRFRAPLAHAALINRSTMHAWPVPPDGVRGSAYPSAAHHPAESVSNALQRIRHRGHVHHRRRLGQTDPRSARRARHRPCGAARLTTPADKRRTRCSRTTTRAVISPMRS